MHIFQHQSENTYALAIDFLNDIFVNILAVLQGGATGFHHIGSQYREIHP